MASAIMPHMTECPQPGTVAGVTFYVLVPLPVDRGWTAYRVTGPDGEQVTPIGCRRRMAELREAVARSDQDYRRRVGAARVGIDP